MNGERFSLDTNILIYALDTTAGAKHTVAAQIVDRAVDKDCSLSLQSLAEFYAAVTRKGLVPKAEAAAQIEDWLVLFPTLAPTAAAVRSALSGAVAGRSSYWDGLLVATVAEAGCTILFSEDMASSGTLGGVRVINPFDDAALANTAADVLG